MKSNDTPKNTPRASASKGACIINLENGSKECVPETTSEECADLCTERPGSDCQLSSDIQCPRGS
jgi:hypothetical protein